MLINLSIPLLTSRVIDNGIATNDTGYVARTAAIMVALIVAGMCASAISSALGVRLAFNTVTDMRRDLYAHAQSLSFANLDRLTTGEILTRLTSDITKVTQLLAMSVAWIAQLPIMFIGALSVILLIDVSLVVIVLVMIPVIGLIVMYTISRSNVLFDAVQRCIDRLNTVLQENIHGAEVIKVFVRQDHERKRFDEVTDDLAGRASHVNRLVASLFPTLVLVSSLGVAGVLWLGGASVIDGNLTEGELVAFISYMAMVAMPLMMFAFIQPMISAATASIARIDEIFNEKPAVEEPANGIDLAETGSPGEITFRNVSFAYGGAAGNDSPIDRENALTDINLTIRQGTTVAILGATGSGKSSLIHLIPRLYDATSGQVEIGGVDVRRLTKESVRRSIGIALQQPQLFGGTVMENLRYGRPTASDERAIDAAKAAQAYDFIMEMPEGFQSIIEQNGANLSGGQRQRIAIARTLVIDPQIVILDDSTSAVDLETEAAIQDALAELGERTVILVAQRISTALGADEIVVLDDGRVAAHGTHRELLDSSPIYQEIFRSQLGEPVA